MFYCVVVALLIMKVVWCFGCGEKRGPIVLSLLCCCCYSTNKSMVMMEAIGVTWRWWWTSREEFLSEHRAYYLPVRSGQSIRIMELMTLRLEISVAQLMIFRCSKYYYYWAECALNWTGTGLDACPSVVGRVNQLSLPGLCWTSFHRWCWQHMDFRLVSGERLDWLYELRNSFDALLPWDPQFDTIRCDDDSSAINLSSVYEWQKVLGQQHIIVE